MERTEIVSQILAILEDVAEISPEDVNENSVLKDDLDLSSMEILTVVADLEETFGLRIPEKELRNFVTVSDLADYLGWYLSRSSESFSCFTSSCWFFNIPLQRCLYIGIR